MTSKELHELATDNLATTVSTTCGTLANLAADVSAKVPKGDGENADAIRDAVVAFEKCGKESPDLKCSVESKCVLLVSSLLFKADAPPPSAPSQSSAKPSNPGNSNKNQS